MTHAADIFALVTRKFSDASWPPFFDDVDRAGLARFCSGLLASNGLSAIPVSAASAQPGVAYGEMAAKLLNDLREQHEDALRDIGLVLVAHHAPDQHVGTSVANLVAAAIGGDPLAFGVSDAGDGAGVVALDLALSMLASGAARRALVLCLEQTEPWHELLAAYHPAVSNVGAAAVLTSATPDALSSGESSACLALRAHGSQGGLGSAWPLFAVAAQWQPERRGVVRFSGHGDRLRWTYVQSERSS